MTNTYQAYGKKKNKVKIVTYIDGPFFADENLGRKQRQKDLRDKVYECMVERSRNSNIEYIEYRKNKLLIDKAAMFLDKKEDLKTVKYIGKLDKEKLGKYKEKIITEEVVLTDERIKHIKEHHPGDYEKYGKYIPEILIDPAYVVDDSKNLDTVLYMKTIKENENNIQVVIRLNTNQNKKSKKNSILTLWKIKDKTYKQLLRNKEILWKKLDSNE